MCDYSLHAVASRPAKVGETLVTTSSMAPFHARLCRKEDNLVSRYASFPEPNSRSKTTSDTTAFGCQPRVQDFDVCPICSIEPYAPDRTTMPSRFRMESSYW